MADKIVTYVVEVGTEVIIIEAEEDGDIPMITVTKAGQTGYILGVDLGFKGVVVGDWPDDEEWVVIKEYSNKEN